MSDHDLFTFSSRRTNLFQVLMNQIITISTTTPAIIPITRPVLMVNRQETATSILL